MPTVARASSPSAQKRAISPCGVVPSADASAAEELSVASPAAVGINPSGAAMTDLDYILSCLLLCSATMRSNHAKQPATHHITILVHVRHGHGLRQRVAAAVSRGAACGLSS